MAKAPEERERDQGDGQSAAITASDLDERTHAEMLMMYHECADSVRFAKSQQWHTTAGALLIFVVLGVLGTFGPRYGFFIKAIIMVSLILSGGSIYSLAIYQFWQQAERGKLKMISDRFSNILREVRGFTPPREANVHRYILLFFMIVTIVLGNWLLILYLAPFMRFA
jgi:hypothetical protein